MKSMTGWRWIHIACLWAVAIGSAQPCAAQWGQICLELGEIGHTEVADDSAILFFMRDGTIGKT